MALSLTLVATFWHRTPAQLTLVSDSLDANGFLLNPKWIRGPEYPDVEALCRFRVGGDASGARMLRISRDGCTGQRDVLRLNEADRPILFGAACVTNDELGLVRGHINWFPVTITGRLLWKSYEGGKLRDHDITMWLVGPDSLALTSGNSSPPGGTPRKAFELEFNFDETVGRLPRGAHGYWSRLRWAAISRATDRLASRLIDDRMAIVTGLYGLDGVHDFQAELHPVFAMAVLDSVWQVGGQTVQRWAVMVRDRGNEGECSSGVLPFLPRSLPNTPEQLSFTVDLGWLQGATAVNLEPSRDGTGFATDVQRGLRAGQSGPSVKFVRGRHVLVSVSFAKPTHRNDDVLFLGEFQLRWDGAAAGAAMTTFARTPEPKKSVQPDSMEPGRPDRVYSTQPAEPRVYTVPEGYWIWDSLIPAATAAVTPDTASPSRGLPLMEPVVAIPTVRGGSVWCADQGWRKSPSCWPGWRVGLFAGYVTAMVIPVEFPPHSRFHEMAGHVPIVGDLLRPFAIRLEAGADWQTVASNGPRDTRVSARISTSLPTSSRLSRGIEIQAYPIGAVGIGRDLTQERWTGVVAYGAGFNLSGWFAEWRYTKYGPSVGRHSVGIGKILRPPGRKP